MKKIIIAVGAAIIAVAANAAAVSWSATSVKDISGTAIGAKAESAGWTAVCTIFASDGTTVVGSNTDKTAAMSKFDGTIEGTAAGTTYYAQLVITDNLGNTITSEKAAFTTDSSATYGAINFSTGSMFATNTAKINYDSGWVAAPEPTSGLLLLLGVAGLALKRKRV